MEHWIQKIEIYKGPIFSVESGVIELDDGSIVERQVVRHQGSVAIVAILDDGIIFIRQPRIAVGKEVLEIPAGRIENGEDPKAAALRELAEETGYDARKLIPGPVYYSSVGFLDEKVHLFLADDLYPSKAHDRKEGAMPGKKQQVNEDEGLSQLILSVAEVEKKLASHGFEDSKTIIGLQNALDYIKKKESPLDHRTLYGWYADENHKYNTLIWQFPAAIIALNIVAIDKLGTGSLLLVAMFLINLVLLYCVAKHVWHQKKFTDALKIINKSFIENYEELAVAKFDGPHFFKLPAGRVLVWSLAVFNLAYLVIAVLRQL